MRPLMFIPLAAVLALAACDDTQDVAQTEPEAITRAPVDTAAAPPPVTTTAPAQDMAAAPSSANEPRATGAVSASASIQPGTYKAQDVSLDLGQDGTFTMTNPSTGDEAEGEYQLEGNVLTLMTEGAPAGPMTCEIVPSGEGFEVTATDSSCEPLDGQMFQPQS